MEDNNTSDNQISKLCLNYDNEKSDSESTHSTPEDERIKRLFFTCDTNGDGFITSEDIRQVCIQLEMEYCVEEIMRELGTDTNGRISYTDFAKRRSELLDIRPTESDTSEDCESTISESKEPLLDESSPASSRASSFGMDSNQSSSVADGQGIGLRPNRLSIHCNESKEIWSQREVTLNETESSGFSNTDDSLQHQKNDRNDSWEFDSGTHDLEVDTLSLHKQIEISGIEIPKNINEVLELANKYYIQSINCIKQEKRRIHSQLKCILKEHEFLQKQVIYLKEEKIYIIKDLEKKKLRERKEYIDKITELQSIIAELSQNLNYYQFLTIKEEEYETIEADNEINLSSEKSNKNLKNDMNCKERENQLQNDLILSETESIDNIDNNDSKSYQNDSHANDLQIDRLECKVSHLETQIDLSALEISANKERAERLTVLLAKYDSNNTALELALNYSEKELEINELFVVLLESEIGLVLANCRAAGLGKTVEMSESDEREEVMKIYSSAQHNRKRAEELALEYLIRNCSESDIKSIQTFSRKHEIQLKDILNKLNLEKSFVKNSITKLEPIIEDSDQEINSMLSSNPMSKHSTNNIENIVLIQDLVSIKEINANLRLKTYSLQKENSNLVQQVMKLKTNYKKKMKTDFKELDENERKVNKICVDSVDQLKKVNDELSEELERIKKKYSMKMRKMDQKMASMSQRNSAHVKILQNKISLLESEDSVRKCIETTL